MRRLLRTAAALALGAAAMMPPAACHAAASAAHCPAAATGAPACAATPTSSTPTSSSLASSIPTSSTVASSALSTGSTTPDGIPGSIAAPAQSRQPARRVITLAPSLTELVYAAGGGDRLVATVTSSDYPPAARRLPRVGDGINIDLERVLSLKPDLVLAWQPSGATRALAPALHTLRIPLEYMAPSSLDDIARDVGRLGGLLGTAPQADAAAAALARRIAALRARYAGRRTISVFIEIGTEPLYTIGRDTLLNSTLRICGGVNIYARSSLAAPQVDAESVLLARPDAVIAAAAANGRRRQQRQAYWSALRLPAARAGHVYAIDPDELFRPGPRLVQAAADLCRDLDEVRAATAAAAAQSAPPSGPAQAHAAQP